MSNNQTSLINEAQQPEPTNYKEYKDDMSTKIATNKEKAKVGNLRLNDEIPLWRAFKSGPHPTNIRHNAQEAPTSFQKARTILHS